MPRQETRAEPPGVPTFKGWAGRRGWKLWMEQRENPEKCDVQEPQGRQCFWNKVGGCGAGGCKAVRVYWLHPGDHD